MTVIIAGERSGVGKTTITLGLLAALCRGSVALGSGVLDSGALPDFGTLPSDTLSHTKIDPGVAPPLRVQSFKVGPDYIDPMFHQRITERSCRNLDPVLTSENYVKACFQHHMQGADFGLVEGVMGLFDGVDGKRLGVRDLPASGLDFASTAHIARLLALPIVLVIDCSRLSGSVAAIVQGYRSFDPRLNLAGVVLNRVGSDRHRHLLTQALAPLDVPILGLLQRQDNIAIPDRHLGLVPTAELGNLDQVLVNLTAMGETCFDWPQLLPLLAADYPTPVPKIKNTVALGFPQDMPRDCSGSAQGLSPLRLSPGPLLPPQSSNTSASDQYPSYLNSQVSIAIAYDRAFSFYYLDNLDLLQALGAHLIFWSPLTEPLPQAVQGLYLGGGFPEVFAAQLAANLGACESVYGAITAGMPTYAECGGLLYLCEQLIDFGGQAHRMVGILPTVATMGKRLTLGYRRAMALGSSPLLEPQMILWGHEFHRSHLSTGAPTPLFTIQGSDLAGQSQTEGWHQHNLHASYIHLHWGACPEIPTKFIDHCRAYRSTSSKV